MADETTQVQPGQTEGVAHSPAPAPTSPAAAAPEPTIAERLKAIGSGSAGDLITKGFQAHQEKDKEKEQERSRAKVEANPDAGQAPKADTDKDGVTLAGSSAKDAPGTPANEAGEAPKATTTATLPTPAQPPDYKSELEQTRARLQELEQTVHKGQLARIGAEAESILSTQRSLLQEQQGLGETLLARIAEAEADGETEAASDMRQQYVTLYRGFEALKSTHMATVRRYQQENTGRLYTQHEQVVSETLKRAGLTDGLESLKRLDPKLDITDFHHVIEVGLKAKEVALEARIKAAEDRAKAAEAKAEQEITSARSKWDASSPAAQPDRLNGGGSGGGKNILEMIKGSTSAELIEQGMKQKGVR